MREAPQTMMRAEINEIPAMLRRQIADGLDSYWEVGAGLRAADLSGFVTCARGTSDHAATFFKYLIETQTGYPVASIGPSVASLYDAPLRLKNFACVSFSQSGGSPDLSALQAAAKAGGAQTIAVLNETDSPMGQGAATILPIYAGPEKAVAATKSYVGMLFATLGLLAGFKQDGGLKEALLALPGLAEEAIACDWSSATVPIASAKSVFCVGRGPGLAVAGEAALKFKETCGLHAEAYSAAELLHGPVAIADASLVGLLFNSGEKERKSVDVAEEKLKSFGARTFRVSKTVMDNHLPVPSGAGDCLMPLLEAIAFYCFVEDLSRKLGHDPDAPVGLRKVTKTL